MIISETDQHAISPACATGTSSPRGISYGRAGCFVTMGWVTTGGKRITHYGNWLTPAGERRLTQLEQTNITTQENE